MRQDELRAPNLSCAAQLFAADAFRAGPSGFSVLPPIRSARGCSCCRLCSRFGLWRYNVFRAHFRVPVPLTPLVL